MTRLDSATIGPVLLQRLTALLAGAVQAASISWPFAFKSVWLSLQPGEPVWWLQCLSLATLAHLLTNLQNEESANRSTLWKHAAVLGWCFATAWLSGTVGWTFVAMHTYGGLHAVLAALAVLALAGTLALYYAAICGLYSALAPASRVWAAMVFAALWLLAEMARGTFLSGFGWGASGYAHLRGPLANYAPWLGVYGLSAFSAWLAMNLAQWVGTPYRYDFRVSRAHRQRVLSLLYVLCVLALPWFFRTDGADASRSAGHLSLTLLQGNIPQNEKFELGSGVPQALEWYAEQLNNSRGALVVAPETAIALLPQQLPPGYWATLTKRFDTGPQAALIGIPLGNFESGYTNSVVGLQPGQAQSWRYDKHHLVPFGEFIPPFFKWFTELMNIPLGDFNRGALKQPPFEWQGQRLAATICYEDLFSEELAPQFTDPLRAPTVFVNVSNLAWFGHSLAMDQHLSIARMRALEFARPFVLATNTGLSAVVDYRGHVTHSMPRNTRGMLEAVVEGRSGVTPYARWLAYFGLAPLWLLALGVVSLAGLPRLRNR